MAAQAPSALLNVRQRRCTLCPALASFWAAEKPMPELAPVIRIVFGVVAAGTEYQSPAFASLGTKSVLAGRRSVDT